MTEATPDAARGVRPSAAAFEALLAEAPVVAIIRHADSTHTLRSAAMLADAGIRLAEVTTTTPDWAGLVRTMDPRIFAGAGSVTTISHVEEAASNGARFIVSPGLDADVVTRTLELGMEPVPGCATATEVQAAHRLGVRTIKLYPASAFGPAYVRALRAPLPAIRLLPTGGVTIDDISQWISAGSVGVALGAELVGRTSSSEESDLEAVRERARRAVSLAIASRGAAA